MKILLGNDFILKMDFKGVDEEENFLCLNHFLNSYWERSRFFPSPLPILSAPPFSFSTPFPSW